MTGGHDRDFSHGSVLRRGWQFFAGEEAVMKGVLSGGLMIRCLVVGLLCFSGAASGYTLSFSPAAQSIALGGSATVEVRIAGILPGPPGSYDGLGDYDFEVVYDPAIIAYNHASDAFSLGFAIGLGVDNSQAGRLKVSDFSLEFPDDLLALQSDAMLLFSLAFDSLAPGTSALLSDLPELRLRRPANRMIQRRYRRFLDVRQAGTGKRVLDNTAYSLL
jgi:hypothetical protein